MQQLSGQDASFVYSELPNAPMHITGVTIYDPSTAPGGKVTFKGILAYMEARLHLARSFRQKMVRVPFDLDHPWWVEDAEFDLEYHVRHIALPKPGDWRQFCIQVARLHARPLDMNRPLWETYVIEGLDGMEGVPKGSFALVSKTHHAAIDGKSGVEIANAIHTATPIVEEIDAPAVPWKGEKDPSAAELYTRAMANLVRRPLRAARVTSHLVPGLGRAFGVARRNDGAVNLGNAPRTRFNGPVSAHRVVDARFFGFADLKPMRAKVPGATVNDVALSVIGGALRAYLEGESELPDVAMRAMTPVSVRVESEKADMGNQVSAMVVSLATDIADPVERLAAVHRSTAGSKELTQAIGARTLTDLSQLAPGALIGLGTRVAGTFARRGNSGAVNCVVTNVPGWREPLYFAGARTVRSFGAGPVTDGMGLINIVTSYEQDFVLSFTSCREIMPDPARYAGLLESTFYALRDA
ncbi:MAG: wax ester/triacylglycerol synthase family O-acyltransferase [Ilumatobacteraceae bacterium]